MILIVLFAAGLCALGYGAASAVSPRSARLDRAAAAFPFGAGLYTLSVSILYHAASLPLRCAPLLSLLAAEAALALIPLSLAARGPSGAAAEPARAPLSRLARFELFLLVAVLCALVPAGILVPVPYWDAYTEYLPVAERVFAERLIPWEASPAAGEVVNAFPQGFTLLIGTGYIVLGRAALAWARLLSPLYGALILFLLWRTARRHLGFSVETALAGLLLCATLPVFFEVMIAPTATVPFCFCAVAALYFLLDAAKGGGRGPLVLAGLFLGLSFWTSYTGTVLIACVAAICIPFAVARRAFPAGWGLRLRDAVLLLAVALSVAAPHLIRNWLLLGNPLYPALYPFFGGMRIDDWSIAHLIPRIMPGRSFHLRLRWEVFHEGFLVQALFFLSLLSRPRRMNREGTFLASFCLLYLGFYLAFFTWPRSSGISIKLLLPSLIPACLFAGERLERLLRREMPAWQGAALLALIPAWGFVMLRDETLCSSALFTAASLRVPALLSAVRAVSVDSVQALAWAGVLLCLLAPRKGAGRLAPALLLSALAFRPIAEASDLLGRHVACTADPSYSFWNSLVFPFYIPERKWLATHLPPNAVIGTFDNRSSAYPRRIAVLDNSAFWPLYRGMGIDEELDLLRRNGVTHLCISDYLAHLHPLSGKAAFFGRLGDPAYFPLVYAGTPGGDMKVYAVAPPRGGRP